MTVPNTSITASAAFWEQFDPLAQLRQNVRNAFEQDNLVLAFMTSRPPTQEECEVGFQVLEVGTTDLPYDQMYLYHDTYGLAHNSPCALTHILKSDDWVGLSELMASRNNTTATPTDNDLLNLVPATALSGDSAWVYAEGVDTRMDRGGQISHRGRSFTIEVEPTPYRWALLTTFDTFTAMSRVLATSNNAQHPTDDALNRPQDTCLLDLRGGIPLTVGPRASNANVWLGQMEADMLAQLAYTGYMTSYQLGVDIARIHVPMPVMA